MSMNFKIKDLKCISYYQYLSSNRRFITKRGKAWRKEFVKQIEEQMKENNYTITESKNIQMNVHFVFDNRRCNDLDNALKALMDNMEGLVFTNDRWVQKLVLSKEIVIKPTPILYNTYITVIDLEKDNNCIMWYNKL